MIFLKHLLDHKMSPQINHLCHFIMSNHYKIYSSKEVLHHLDFFIFLRDILTNKF